MTKERTLIHVEFKSGGHHYFGSIAAIFEMFDSTSLGVTQKRLYSYNIEAEKPYSNKTCTIRKGELRQKKGNRCEHMKKKSDE
jgi:hypothetical protein